MKMPEKWPTEKMAEIGNKLAASYGIHSAKLVFRAMIEVAPEPEQDQDSVEEMRQRKNEAYEERNRVVAFLARLFPSGVARTAIEGWSEDWHGCVFIDLPGGQASWHFHDSQAHLFEGLPQYTKAWDGHSTKEKYDLLAGLCWSDNLIAIAKNSSYPLSKYDIRALAELCGFITLKAEEGTDIHPYVYAFARGLLALNQNEVDKLKDELASEKECLEVTETYHRIEVGRLINERDLLGESIRNAALKAGIVREDASLTGPMLVMLCDNLADLAAVKRRGVK